jgi:hypothetical protein
MGTKMFSDERRLKTRLVDGLNFLLARKGQIIVSRQRLYEWQRSPVRGAAYNPVDLPDEAKVYLVSDNSRLLDLKRRYADWDPDVVTPLIWDDCQIRPEDIANFRGDNAYVWQVRDSRFNFNVLGYILATYYVKSIDHHHRLLSRLGEDCAFGNFTFEIAGTVVSRDLLDSIIEIDFLDRHLRVMSRPQLRILDIGAGYGRLAHRAATAIPGLEQYLCTDAVPYSTFISEFYLRYRKATDKAEVVPLDEIETRLAATDIDVALNIHSFPECRLPAIEWWLSRLARRRIPYLMLVCISPQLENYDRQDFSAILDSHGYRLMIHEPKYRDPLVQQYAMAPDHYFLFELGR